MCETLELRLHPGFGKDKGAHLSAMRKARDEIAEHVSPEILKQLDDLIAIAVVEDAYVKHLPDDPKELELLAPKRKKPAVAKTKPKAESKTSPKSTKVTQAS